eukprot:3397505-Rhodomonas_salina.1
MFSRIQYWGGVGVSFVVHLHWSRTPVAPKFKTLFAVLARRVSGTTSLVPGYPVPGYRVTGPGTGTRVPRAGRPLRVSLSQSATVSAPEPGVTRDRKKKNLAVSSCNNHPTLKKTTRVVPGWKRWRLGGERSRHQIAPTAAHAPLHGACEARWGRR